MAELEHTAWGLVEDAESETESIPVEQLQRELSDRDRDGSDDGDDTDSQDPGADEPIVVDIRDVRERWIEGSIPGAKHAPRGMIEFWADPGTEYYRDFFEPRKRYVLYCNAAGRSALVAKRLEEMGFEDVVHLEGGFTAWQAAGGEVEDVPQRDYKDR